MSPEQPVAQAHPTEDGASSMRLVVAADARYAAHVRESIAAFAGRHAVNEEDARLLLTALGEAFANAVEHARAARPVEVECRLDSERIVATIQDAGVGFAGHAAAAVGLPSLDEERGRGLAIMRYCSDLFTIESAPGRGTRVQVGRILRDRTPSRPGQTTASSSAQAA